MLVEDFQSYIRNMTLNFICSTAFWTQCQLCSWICFQSLHGTLWLLLMKWRVRRTEVWYLGGERKSGNKFNLLALIMSYVNRKSVCYQWLLITQPAGFLPPAKFKFILSWEFITARNNSGHDIMARSLCVTVRNEKWHVFAQGYLHDLVYWIFIISRQKLLGTYSRLQLHQCHQHSTFF